MQQQPRIAAAGRASIDRSGAQRDLSNASNYDYLENSLQMFLLVIAVQIVLYAR